MNARTVSFLLFVVSSLSACASSRELPPGAEARTDAASAVADAARETPADASPGVPSSDAAVVDLGCLFAPAILATTCAEAACHDDDGPIAGLDFVSPGVEARLLNTTPTLCGMEAPYIDGEDPARSFILQKVQHTPACGTGMPPAPLPMLPSDEIECIRSWVFAVAEASR
jgi:hypothetical protein